MRIAFSALVLAASIPALPALAAVELPQESPGATLTQKIGTATVTLTYHRPAVKGRTIWGGLVPYGDVWRLGANDATTIALSHDGKVGGKDLPKGRYALFAIPTRDTWTFIVNKRADQWGAYFYKPAEDVLRFEVKPTPLAAPVEWMTVTATPDTPRSLRIEIAWEKLKVEFPVEFDVDKIVWADIDAALAAAKPDDNVVYLQAAQYARKRGQRLEMALPWVEKSLAIKESFWTYEMKARLLADAGKTAEAVPLLQKARDLSVPAGAPKEYTANLDKEIAEWKAKVK